MLRISSVQQALVNKIKAATRTVNRVYNKRNPYCDATKILLASGTGGDGAVRLLHNAQEEFAGPGGGNGGRGGHIFLKATRKFPDLAHIKAHGSYIQAGSGVNGGNVLMHGKTGDSIILEVPLGTQVSDVDTNTVMYDMTKEGQEVVLLEGGKGGKGNAAFKSAMQQLPLNATRGMPGNTMLTLFELKTKADVGLIGLPNSGKSTIISALTTCRPDVAMYPFCTLHPLVGQLQDIFGGLCTVADLPALVEGSYENRGLGNRFLRHVERSKMLAYVVDIARPYRSLDDEAAGTPIPQPWDVILMLKDELEFYEPGLSDRATMVIVNKMDVEKDFLGRDTKVVFAELCERLAPLGLTILPMSAKICHDQGPVPSSRVADVVKQMCDYVFALKKKEKAQQEEAERLLDRDMQEKFSMSLAAHSPQKEPSYDVDQYEVYWQEHGIGDNVFYPKAAQRYQAPPVRPIDIVNRKKDAVDELQGVRCGWDDPKGFSLVDEQLDAVLGGGDGSMSSGGSAVSQDFSAQHNLPQPSSVWDLHDRFNIEASWQRTRYPGEQLKHVPRRHPSSTKRRGDREQSEK